MSEELKLTIDGKNIQMPKGSLILDAAEEAGIPIPTLCYSRHTKAMGLCRVCVVEVEDRRGLQPACVTPVRAGMVVHTRTPENRAGAQNHPRNAGVQRRPLRRAGNRIVTGRIWGSPGPLSVCTSPDPGAH